ncbi:carboxylesterase family protein [Streptomyces sp. ADI98-10]|uniref:carboxylesterase/lipase family protein n=1 Tax=Streptomyces sp. ADI98-10 TaxID=1522763 RepID=UPI000F5597B1|nr:carboxylesterase family protein [Streptomyces sp. ADI98-10]RPK88273.1 Carboxylesterase [Streptomyces sp. ADI98-10]
MDVFTTKAGMVRGRRTARDRSIVTVRGLPYAAPPFGARRFREPRPAEPWDGVRDCTAFGPIAPQSAELPGAPVWSPGDEDILTLNIWTPADGPGDLPVLVWIHGGAYVFGSSAQPDFDGTALAGRGLVVVTLNSRLGFEGFGHVPDTEGSTEPALDAALLPDADGDAAPFPDNRGLLDQIAALEWVRDNISAFGGSPDRVTLAGQSSGATSAACLTVADRARGLFRRAVLHSAVNAFATVEQAARITAEVAAAAGVPATRAGLLAAPPEALVAAGDQVCERYAQDPGSGQRHYDPAIYGPVADGVLLTADPLEALAAGAGGAVELLVCHATEEYWLLDAVGSSVKITTEEQLAAFAADFGLPASLVEGHRERLPDASVPDVHLSLHSGLLFAEYSTRLAEAHALAGGRAFLARFDRRRDRAGHRVRAWHCADIPFAFGNLHEESVHFLVGGPPGPADQELSGRMTRAWAEFAAHGDPGWGPLDGPAGSAATVRVWRTADEDGPGRDAEGGFRDLWRTAGLPLLAP